MARRILAALSGAFIVGLATYQFFRKKKTHEEQKPTETTGKEATTGKETTTGKEAISRESTEEEKSIWKIWEYYNTHRVMENCWDQRSMYAHLLADSINKRLRPWLCEEIFYNLRRPQEGDACQAALAIRWTGEYFEVFICTHNRRYQGYWRGELLRVVQPTASVLRTVFYIHRPTQAVEKEFHLDPNLFELSKKMFDNNVSLVRQELIDNCEVPIEVSNIILSYCDCNTRISTLWLPQK